MQGVSETDLLDLIVGQILIWSTEEVELNEYEPALTFSERVEDNMTTFVSALEDRFNDILGVVRT